MKKQLFFGAILLSMAASSTAQTSLPYYSGFDNAAEKAGWVNYFEGLQDPMQLGWIYQTDQPKSAPSYLAHEYWGDATTLTKDWIISPPFNFSNGGTFKCALLPYVYPAVTANDSINLYLLNGSQDPMLASKTLLAAFAGKATDVYAWDSSGIIHIPPTSGTSYIAFKYVGLNEWFTVGIDNIHIASATTGVDELGSNTGTEAIRFYPNPASDYLYWNSNGNACRTARICDITGKQVAQFDLDQKRFDVSMLPQAFYIIETGNRQYKFVKY